MVMANGHGAQAVGSVRAPWDAQPLCAKVRGEAWLLCPAREHDRVSDERYCMCPRVTSEESPRPQRA